MQYPGKPLRPNSKIKNHNNQLTQPYNTGLHFLSSANVCNTAQLPVDAKYLGNMANSQRDVVLQYRNVHVKNNIEMNRFTNLRQQQPFMYKNTQYHNHLNPNVQQRFSLASRTNAIDQAGGNAYLPQPSRKPEFYNKKNKHLGKIQNSNYLNSKSISKDHDPNIHTLKEEPDNGENINIVRHKQQQQVPEKVNQIVKNVDNDANKENINSDIERSINKLLNSSSEQSPTSIEEQKGSNNGKDLKREKTPMCLVNDLARFNKITFQYRLTSENGPAHLKHFTVTLTLGSEQYTAEGLKIKEAQHLAAKEAIEKTKYKHPLPKVNRRSDDDAVKPIITPTVELNALAMKMGQQTYYIIEHQEIDANHALQQQQPQPSAGTWDNQLTHKQGHQQQRLPRYSNNFYNFQYMLPNGPHPANYTLYSPSCPTKVKLIVGTKNFVGIGRTLQLAKHNAASHALKVLKEQIEREQSDIQQKPIVEVNDSKSPISLVFEIGIKRNMLVDFKVVREEGPAHMRTFITACIVGDIMTEGEGTCKKISKKKAANKMLEELNKLPSLTPVTTPVKRTKLKAVSSSKKSTDEQTNDNATTDAETKTVEKEFSHQRNKKFNADMEPSNPINKLIEWHQLRKEKQPEFKVINEFAGQENSRRKEFVVEVSSNNIVVRGVGINKRIAKQDAAQKFLNAVANISEPHTESITAGNESFTKKYNVAKKFKNENMNKSTIGRTFNKQEAANKQQAAAKETDTNNQQQSAAETKEHLKETVTNVIEKPLSQNCNNLLTNDPAPSLTQEKGEQNATTNSASSVISTTTDAATLKVTNPTTVTTTTSQKTFNHHMKDKLLYLAKLFGFEVEFSDYPKGNHSEFLTIVMISTTPPQICHGVGNDANESKEDAAKNALNILSEMGLNNLVKS